MQQAGTLEKKFALVLERAGRCAETIRLLED